MFGADVCSFVHTGSSDDMTLCSTESYYNPAGQITYSEGHKDQR